MLASYSYIFNRLDIVELIPFSCVRSVCSHRISPQAQMVQCLIVAYLPSYIFSFFITGLFLLIAVSDSLCCTPQSSRPISTPTPPFSKENPLFPCQSIHVCYVFLEAVCVMLDRVFPIALSFSLFCKGCIPVLYHICM